MKPWYKSKTILVNAVAAALTALEASTGMLKPILGDSFYLIVAVGLPVVNAMLRTVTTQPLGKPEAPDEHGGLL
ncbi:hypothetical protein COW36_09115 [bacterium (Candidatus Blackallbacteria) CG17_big_fil_post_rev_8_21_14_2_50_48_46]|uniref:Holin n=1 Tax=bacterium (Candidatus Blackallbacteria) CG17_big_fil_post_rev_8_21_14_2_50_48_46 TaxID=2014261 RepID=A0A2M7G5T7_9BACT|nr:MAG: hypothetical protein COW64_23935 [bacterium (Candidatus Blackallbacteria) CG18_big_fil_WC_8_21_14_2_50_49_26]PIW17325.1 MAG: hypothetical protein COW36_09115 [bacterium (Candidatus Blackallbacteria) CG17_big_fil_post_rev_8_21_14_2_50_48_46]PIW47443.1 MAG: hypothetical protein COW20_12715 [bacterium (Candidatus Blackallbacteria) CG13_big_fil_rev_8_21_14_2_50_49_14]